MNQETSRVSTIQIRVGLDQNNIPEKMHWQASDAEPGDHEAAAMLLALWNQQEKTSMRIDLWTKDMTVPEMNIFFFQTLLGMTDSYERATQNKKAADELRSFAKSFFEKVQEQG